jgi:uncharacterized protein (DUF1330 family)
MAVYALVELEITNMDGMAPYIKSVPGTVAAHGGKYLVSAGTTDVVEGSLGQYPIKVVLEFASMAAARGWYNSPEYQALLPYRTRHSKSNFVWVNGV